MRMLPETTKLQELLQAAPDLAPEADATLAREFYGAAPQPVGLARVIPFRRLNNAPYRSPSHDPS